MQARFTQGICAEYGRKLQDEEFLTDTEMILGPQVEYAPQGAWERVKSKLVERLNPEA